MHAARIKKDFSTKETKRLESSFKKSSHDDTKNSSLNRQFILKWYFHWIRTLHLLVKSHLKSVHLKVLFL